MGGQACVLYGAAEFSRDTDIVLLAEPVTLDRLRLALEQLQAKCIAVPPFEPEYLNRGHAVHFRCHHPEAERMRLDVMSTMRGVDPFPQLWLRRTTIELAGSPAIDALALPDLIQAKKTQRDKDWPMIRRLVEAHVRAHWEHPTPERIAFWLSQGRDVSLLQKLATLYPEDWSQAQSARPLLTLAKPGRESDLEQALYEEEAKEREADRQYWTPLKKELEQLRLRRSSP
jgi:hypothetical protein